MTAKKKTKTADTTANTTDTDAAVDSVDVDVTSMDEPGTSPVPAEDTTARYRLTTNSALGRSGSILDADDTPAFRRAVDRGWAVPLDG